MELIRQRYGKTKVRILKKLDDSGKPAVKELNFTILLQGEFSAPYFSTDNSSIVATDSLKNFVYVSAYDHLGDVTATFLMTMVHALLAKYDLISQVEIEAEERAWRPFKQTNHFRADSGSTAFSKVVAARRHHEIKCGIKDLVILKTAGSAFRNYIRDEFTTLPETDDRLLATSLTAEWTYSGMVEAGDAPAIVGAMLDRFAEEKSPSVQRTLFRMGEAALEVCARIASVRLVMPNLHCLPVNLTPFGRENSGQIFVPTEEPQGWIEAEVGRGRT